MNTITEFFGRYRFLSNFYPAKVDYMGLTFDSVEAAYQAAKFEDPEIHEAFVNLTASQAKKLGNRLSPIRDDWEEVKFDIMLELVRKKFNNMFLQKQLLETKDAILEEGNTWGDKVWGICPPNSNNGKNWLGKILMQVREELQIKRANEAQQSLSGYKTVALEDVPDGTKQISITATELARAVELLKQTNAQQLWILSTPSNGLFSGRLIGCQMAHEFTAPQLYYDVTDLDSV